MTIDQKYNEMLRKSALALAALSDVEPMALKSIPTLWPHEDIAFEQSIRTLLKKNITEEQKTALSELNYAYMTFIAECRKSLPREEVGKIVNLTLAFHGLVGFFMNEHGEWDSQSAL